MESRDVRCYTALGSAVRTGGAAGRCGRTATSGAARSACVLAAVGAFRGAGARVGTVLCGSDRAGRAPGGSGCAGNGPARRRPALARGGHRLVLAGVPDRWLLGFAVVVSAACRTGRGADTDTAVREG